MDYVSIYYLWYSFLSCIHYEKRSRTRTLVGLLILLYPIVFIKMHSMEDRTYLIELSIWSLNLPSISFLSCFTELYTANLVRKKGWISILIETKADEPSILFLKTRKYKNIQKLYIFFFLISYPSLWYKLILINIY